jgi:hypothetical protein
MVLLFKRRLQVFKCSGIHSTSLVKKTGRIEKPVMVCEDTNHGAVLKSVKYKSRLFPALLMEYIAGKLNDGI